MIRYLKKKFNIKTDILFVRIATLLAHIGFISSFFIFNILDFVYAAVASFILSVFIDLGYHRYFSHKAFKAGKLFEILTVVCTLPAAVGSPLAWAALHRLHHKTSDTADDPHSPTHISLFQMLSLDYDYSRFDRTIFFTKDFLRSKFHVWLHQHYFDLVFGLYLITFIVSPTLFMILCAWPAVYNYYTYMVTNYLEHVNFPLSERPYPSGDNSVNNIFLNWLTFGHTGLHNNHHYKQNSWRYDIGGSWWEFDSGRWMALLFNKIGLIKLNHS